jgi:hypothetical protein
MPITPKTGSVFRAETKTVEARLHNARNLLVEVLVRQFGPAFGGVYQLAVPSALRTQ